MRLPTQRIRCRKRENPVSACFYLQLVKDYGDSFPRLFADERHDRAHFRVYAPSQPQCEYVPPFPEVRLHDDVRRGGVGQHLPCVLRLLPAVQKKTVRFLGVQHTLPPELRNLVAAMVEERLDEGDITLHVHEPLALDTETCQAMTCQLRHNIAGSGQCYTHVRKFQRR